MVTRGGDTGWMNLNKVRIGHCRTAPVGPPDRGHIAAFGIGRQEINVAVAAGCKHDGIGCLALDFTGYQVAIDDAARPTIGNHKIHDLRTRMHLDCTVADLFGKR